MNKPSTSDARFALRALRAAGVVALVALAALLVVLEGRILTLLLAGILFALALRAASASLSSWTRAPYGVALAVVATTVIVLLGLGSYALGSGMAGQVEALGKQIPEAWHSLLAAIHAKPGFAPVADRLGQGIVPGADRAAVAAGAGGVVEAFVSVIVVFFLGVYGAAQPDAYARVVLLLVPRRHRKRVRAALYRTAAELTRWLAGRLVAMVIVGALVAVGLLLLRIPLAWGLGALAGILAFVEYLGAYASAAPAMLLAFTRGPIYAVVVGVMFTGVHVLEGYVLTPLLVRKTVRFPPGYTLAAQVLLGAVYGVAGLTFATPILIVGTVFVKKLYIEPRDAAESRRGRGARRRESEPSGRERAPASEAARAH